tara:strand:+ start:308 stop:682 length:375 start_codon:yes stop_codon:yes gene_type:complete
MDIQTSIKTCFNKYATFSGRASRSEYWFFILFGVLGGIVTLIIDVMILDYSIESEYTPINSIFSLILIIPSIAVACRRLHDVNKSGWWQLIWLTIIGGIFLLIWYVKEGEKIRNRFGAPIKIKK